MQKAKDLLAYSVLRLLVAVVQAMSVERAEIVCEAAAALLAHRIPLRRKLTDRNLRLVYPAATDEQINTMRYAMWRHLLLMVCEIAWAPRRLQRSNFRQHVHFERKRDLVTHLLNDRPLIAVTGHFGNFEVAGYVTGLLGLPTMTIARPLDNPYINRFVTDFRGADGQIMVPKVGSATLVQRHLSEGGTLSLLADQYAGVKGCWTHFLGVPSSCHKALALFSLMNDAPMCAFSARRRNKPMQFVFGCHGIADPRSKTPEVAGVRQLTQWYNDRLAEAINQAPEQYWWLHRRWRGEPPKRYRRVRLPQAA